MVEGTRAEGGTWLTFLVEHYRPGLTPEELCAWATRVREAADEIGRQTNAVQFVDATVVPADESMLCTVEAMSEQLVRDVYTRAAIPFERITVVVPAERRREGER